MNRLLVGRYDSRISVKGRISLPSRFANIIGKELVIARWYENCLVIVSSGNWDKFLNRITLKDELITKSVRGVDRFILGSSYLVSTDSQSRFVVPRLLRDFAKLKDKITFLGLADRIELWDQEKWEVYEKSVEMEALAAIEKISRIKNG